MVIGWIARGAEILRSEETKGRERSSGDLDRHLENCGRSETIDSTSEVTHGNETGTRAPPRGEPEQTSSPEKGEARALNEEKNERRTRDGQ